MTFLAAVFVTPFLFLVLAWVVPEGAVRRALGPLAGLLLVLGALQQGVLLTPTERLLCCSLWLLYVLKGWGLLARPRSSLQTASPGGLLLYAYLWPGLDPQPFEGKRCLDTEWQQGAGLWFAVGFPTMACGLAGLILLALGRELSETARALTALGCLALTVHFGYSDVLSSLVRLAGFPSTACLTPHCGAGRSTTSGPDAGTAPSWR